MGCRWGEGRGWERRMTRKRAIVLNVVLACVCLASAHAASDHAAATKSDFRGLETGMSVAQAQAAAAKNGMTCETSFASRTTCRGGDASVVLVTTGRNGDRIWELQVSLIGHYDGAEMRRRLDGFYGLKATTVPHVFDTASGQQLMLLETGNTSTVFYLIDNVVLHDDAEALPPPKL